MPPTPAADAAYREILANRDVQTGAPEAGAQFLAARQRALDQSVKQSDVTIMLKISPSPPPVGVATSWL